MDQEICKTSQMYEAADENDEPQVIDMKRARGLIM